jgi:hypothetical protein
MITTGNSDNYYLSPNQIGNMFKIIFYLNRLTLINK